MALANMTIIGIVIATAITVMRTIRGTGDTRGTMTATDACSIAGGHRSPRSGNSDVRSGSGRLLKPSIDVGRIPTAARVLLGLVAGIRLGLAIAGTARSSLLFAVSITETIGTLWLNVIRMTVLPLVASLLVSRIAGTSGSVGRIGGKALELAGIKRGAAEFAQIV